MGEVINGYELLAPLSNKNAGFAKWGHARKGGREFFIKEFLNPCYPTRNSPFDTKTKMVVIAECRAYEEEKRRLYTTINRVSDGNLLRIEEFFRWDGKYYITTQWLDTAQKRDSFMLGAKSAQNQMSVEDLYRFGDSDVKMRCALALSHALIGLHKEGIAHADIKPRNIVLSQMATGNISAKIIDVDSSFWVSNPPDELVGDQVYFAPESVLFMIRGKEASPITCAVDVFAMGLVFHQIFSGELPKLPEDYNFACEACLDGEKLAVSERVPESVRGIIEDMLATDASARPSMETVHQRLWKHAYGSEPAEFSDEVRGEASDMRGGDEVHTGTPDLRGGDERRAGTPDLRSGDEVHTGTPDFHNGGRGESRIIFGAGLHTGDGGKKTESDSSTDTTESTGTFHMPGEL